MTFIRQGKIKLFVKLFLVVSAIILIQACEQRHLQESNTLKTEQLVADSTIYSFINFVLSPEDTNHSNMDEVIAVGEIDFEKEDSLVISKMDSVFTKQDIDFIYKQMPLVDSFRLNPELMPGKRIISSDTLNSYYKQVHKSLDEFELYRAKFGENILCTLSQPLFTKDLNKVIITINYPCPGLCGSGGTYIYQKKNGKWELIHQLNGWIS